MSALNRLSAVFEERLDALRATSGARLAGLNRSESVGLNSSDPVELNSKEVPENLTSVSRKDSLFGRARSQLKQVFDRRVRDERSNSENIVSSDELRSAGIDYNSIDSRIQSQEMLDRNIVQRDRFIDDYMGYPLDSLEVAEQVFNLVEQVKRQILEDKKNASEYVQDLDSTQN